MALNRSLSRPALGLIAALIAGSCTPADRAAEQGRRAVAHAAEPSDAGVGAAAARQDRTGGHSLAPLPTAQSGAGTGAVAGRAEASAPGAADAPRPARATAWVIFGVDTVTAEVARTDEERAQGLMYRERLAPDAGMLFIFPQQSVRSFWMQNTYIDLDIAFLDRDFRVVDIQQMDALDTDSHVSRAPAMYALETNQGWFEAHGVRVGDQPVVRFGS